MAAPLAKLSVGRPGLGAAHASYITRISALEPQRNERESSDSQERDHPLVIVHGDHSEPESLWEEATDEALTSGLTYRIVRGLRQPNPTPTRSGLGTRPTTSPETATACALKGRIKPQRTSNLMTDSWRIRWPQGLAITRTSCL